MKKNEKIERWENETQELANYFASRFFGKEPEMYWIADEIGGCLSINDHFFSVNDIVDFIRYKYTPKKMFEYYEYRLERLENKADYTINIKNYLKLKK